MDGIIFAGMSILLQRLMPKSPWLLVAIDGSKRHVDTILYNGNPVRQEAERFLSAHEGREVRCLIGRPKSILIRRPDIDDIKDVSGICIRLPSFAQAALAALKTPPAASFPFQDAYIAVWRFEEPVSVNVAQRIEQLFAKHFGGERLNFFVPVVAKIPYDIFINPKKPEEALECNQVREDDEFLSAAGDPKRRSWAVEPIVQRKKTTLISGDPGMGKSQIALYLAMCVTRGIGMPGQPKPERAGVIICETEDDWDEDVIPRLIAVGADRNLIKGVSIRNLNTKEGVAKLDAAKRKLEAEIGLPVGLLILSPYMECFGKGSTQEEQMRQRILEFKEWERGANLGTLGVAHLGEGGDVAGPKTFKRAARASWKVIVDERDPEPNPKKKRRLLVCDKANNTDDDFIHAYRIEGVNLKGGFKTSKIVWEEYVPFEVAANSAPVPSVQKYSATTLKYVSALQDIFTPGGQPIKGVEVRRALDRRGLAWGRPVYDAAVDVLGIDIGDRGKVTESKLWTPPSQWRNGIS